MFRNQMNTTNETSEYPDNGSVLDTDASYQTYKKKSKFPFVFYKLNDDTIYEPKICNDSNGLDIPFQNKIILKPYELQKSNLGIKFKFPKHYCGILMNKSSARIKFNVSVTLGLIDIGFNDFVEVVIQNMLDSDNILPAGTAVAQLLVIKKKIPEFKNEWFQITFNRGSFGTTGNFSNKL
jgi:dUTPase